MLAVMTDLIGVHFANEHLSFALFHGNRNALNKPFVVFILHLKAVYNNLDAMIPIAVEFHLRHYFLHLAIDSGIKITFATNGFEEFLVMSLAVLNEWSKQDDAFPEVFAQEQTDDLLFRIAHHLFSANVGISLGCSSIKQAKEVINLGRRANRASWVLVGRLLFDADNGTKACNFINIRSFHVAKKVAGIGAEGFDVATLTFGINGIES